ncbi:zinc-ribbon domain containing protein [Marinicella meishanensis]|uniref:zinc-ribbon domain containing protein n=1 Tax=Marinicella meishanensis TaxID=2873263 RepID=UPI001CBC5CC2|nr:zinc-ribbon domain containing protein [Marinicella sp. NBU2979]
MKKYRINKDAYSAASKRSVGHEFLGDDYQDKKYTCKKCRQEAVFLAKDQKEAFEVKKVYMWAHRELCGPCYKTMKSIRTTLRQMQQQYIQDMSAVIADRSFLKVWLELLELYPKFGAKANTARIDFVKKQLTE